MKAATAEFSPIEADLPARRWIDLSALTALFWLTLRQHLRGRRLLILSALFLLPDVLVAVARFTAARAPQQILEFNVIFRFFPHALVPLVALLYAAGIIQDEIEEQTLTYLLLRPLPKWALYLVRLTATWLLIAILTGVFTTVTFIVIWWGKPEFWGDVIPVRAAKTAALMALAQAGYCALFGALGLFTKRSLFVGIGYIIGFELLLANAPIFVRQLTVMYYFRVLVLRWLDVQRAKDWGIELIDAPGEATCVLRVLAASAVLTIFGMLLVTWQEFRMKTPEGS
jgi:ABC-2 type transport system permease protein